MKSKKVILVLIILIIVALGWVVYLLINNKPIDINRDNINTPQQQENIFQQSIDKWDSVSTVRYRRKTDIPVYNEYEVMLNEVTGEYIRNNTVIEIDETEKSGLPQFVFSTTKAKNIIDHSKSKSDFTDNDYTKAEKLLDLKTRTNEVVAKIGIVKDIKTSKNETNTVYSATNEENNMRIEMEVDENGFIRRLVIPQNEDNNKYESYEFMDYNFDLNFEDFNYLLEGKMIP